MDDAPAVRKRVLGFLASHARRHGEAAFDGTVHGWPGVLGHLADLLASPDSDAQRRVRGSTADGRWSISSFNLAPELDLAMPISMMRMADQPSQNPRLLSGGNPQIPKGDGDEPVQAYIDAMPGWKRDVGRELDDLLVRTVPDVRKAVRWNSPFYGIAGNGWFLSFHCFTRYVKVTWHNGSSLDPVPPGDSKHERVRYLDIHEAQELDEELIASWIRQAADLPGEDLF